MKWWGLCAWAWALAATAVADTHYVSPTGTHLPPYTNWLEAATNIQDAIDVSAAGDLVLVTNGIYQTGGRLVGASLLTNRVVIDKPVTVQSVNGAGVTMIRGAKDPGTTNGNAAARCVWMTNGASLVGFTLSNGATRAASEGMDGGGLWASSVNALASNCILAGNSAASRGGGAYQVTLNSCTIAGNEAGSGGGANQSILNHCLLIGNKSRGIASTPALSGGGGAQFSTLNNCTLIGNSARYGGGAHAGLLNSCLLTSNSARFGGGAYDSSLSNCCLSGNSANLFGGGDGGGAYNCRLNNSTIADNSASFRGGGTVDGTIGNCIVFFNSAPVGPNYFGDLITIAYSCTAPIPTSGTGNIADDPKFENQLAGDFRLKPSSPCVDAAINEEWMFEGTDLEGNSRIINGHADMGAYELVFEATLKALLQGAYNTNTHRMAHIPAPPSRAPYAYDTRPGTAPPTNAVDWVNIELRREADGAVDFSRSAWIRDDGVLMSDNGAPPVILEIGTGTHYIVLRHRNHLATMTANPIAFTNRQVPFDFTASAGLNYGGTNTVIEVESTAWALIAGDADGDGRVTAVDRAIVTQQIGLTGYLVGDLNLDGVVNDED